MASNEASAHISVDDINASHFRLQQAVVVLANRMNSLEDSLRRQMEWLAALDVRISTLQRGEAVKPDSPPKAAGASAVRPDIRPCRLPLPIPPPPPKCKLKPKGDSNE